MSHTHLHARIQDFISGGGGGGVQTRRPESSLDLLSLLHSLQRASNGVLTEKTILSKDPEEVQHFPGRSNFFHRGPNANFYRNPYNL